MEPPAAPGPERLFDSHRFIVRVMCSVLGLLVRQNDPRLRGAGARVFIANHVTPFDHNVVSLLTSCNTPALNGAPGFICWSRGFMELGVMGNRAELVDSLKEYSSQRGNPPLLLFPEEAATNGQVGLLRFSSWPFSIMDVVQPVALQVRRPLVAVSVADSSWIAELLWTFFVPFTVYQLLAMELGVVSTRITAADRTEHLKRLRHTSRLPFAPASSQRLLAQPRVPPRLPGGAPEDMQVMAMAQQVKEVLPHVPLEVIRTDLAQTNCVDTTIANLLEGRVSFFPESQEAGTDLPTLSTSQAAAASGIQGSVAASSAKTTTKQFAKSPVERHLSLQERKRALYDYARRALLVLDAPAWDDSGAGQASEQSGESEVLPAHSQPRPGCPHPRQWDVLQETKRRQRLLPASLGWACSRCPRYLSPKEFAFVCSPQPVLWSLQGGAVGRKKRLFSSELLLLFIPSLLLSHLLTLGLGIYIGKRLAASSANPL
ncbi:Ancient ubiquitous protein 1 [Pitangus sulphuratus]|nr:Ancient ubiquitous protein 1 [Pitangus sulphuratus]